MRGDSVLLVGLAGGTASGKTTITRRLVAEHTDILHIGHDRYYRTVPCPEQWNYDHPRALDSALLARHLDRLAAGQGVEVPIYDFATHRRQPRGQRVRPRPVVLVEGILVLAEPRLVERLHLKVWVEADDDLRLLRRLRRDALERGRSVESVLGQWERTVRPMHRAFVAPSRHGADLVLDGEGPVEPQVARLSAAIQGFLEAGDRPRVA